MQSRLVERAKRAGKIVAGGMLREGTPLEYYLKYDLWVKHEEKSCPPPGPPFSKTRGVYAWVSKQSAAMIGVLDTYHSQGGHAVARACSILNKKALVFYPEYKYEPGYRHPQKRALELGAELVGLPAGRSAILYHAAKRITLQRGGVMIPNALKLEESITETAREVSKDQKFDWVVISASSGTIAAGVIQGFGNSAHYIVHLGYSRSHEQVEKYLREKSGEASATIEIIDEKYSYKDKARSGETPPWPCNPYYDLKAFRWLIANRKRYSGSILFWNIG